MSDSSQGLAMPAPVNGDRRELPVSHAMHLDSADGVTVTAYAIVNHGALRVPGSLDDVIVGLPVEDGTVRWIAGLLPEELSCGVRIGRQPQLRRGAAAAPFVALRMIFRVVHP